MIVTTFRKIAISLILMTSLFSVASARTTPSDPTFHAAYGVADWRDMATEKAAEYKNYRIIILANTTYSDDEKAAKIARKYTQIRDAVRKNRTEIYQGVSELRGVGNSATKGSSGGNPKKSAAKWIGGSKEQTYTTAEWARGAYKSGDVDANANVIATGTAVDSKALVSADGSQVCAIALKQSSKGRKVSYSEATFRIRPERIKVIVDTELTSIMYAISNTPL